MHCYSINRFVTNQLRRKNMKRHVVHAAQTRKSVSANYGFIFGVNSKVCQIYFILSITPLYRNNIETCYNWQTNGSLLFKKKKILSSKSVSVTVILKRNLPCILGNVLNITPGQIEVNVVYQDKKNVIRPYSFIFKNFEI